MRDHAHANALSINTAASGVFCTPERDVPNECIQKSLQSQVRPQERKKYTGMFCNNWQPNLMSIFILSWPANVLTEERLDVRKHYHYPKKK